MSGTLNATLIVDSQLTNTSQIITASNNAYFTGQTDVAAVNLYWASQFSTNGGSINGTNIFDINVTNNASNFYMLSSGVGLDYSFSGNASSSARRGSDRNITGTDDTVADALLRDIWYLGGNHSYMNLTFSNLLPNVELYIQLLGNTQWSGLPQVTANGTSIGAWNSNSSGYSIYSFEATASATGTLDVNITSSNYSGLAGFLVSTKGNNTSVPEPSTFAIFALGVMGLASRRFRNKA